MLLRDLPAFAPVEEGDALVGGVIKGRGQGKMVFRWYHGQGLSHTCCTELQAARVGETLGENPWFSLLSWMPVLETELMKT